MRARLRPPVRYTLLSIAIALAFASGCIRVKPYEREYLAHPAMVDDREPGQTRFTQHQTGSREGADGGTGEPGGGCGCN
ncbi:putative lipoprotein [Haliangium ochraceum DSM 14365]|uniref:Putative lipoprotein n=1 Tax=Haliangium ochraceum (strain DSM 14365 / JCM 11303 / SMP-2) TaxID=502025 RepID=D0LH29_HALO1|nr:putative lipoprotein [Haliangium ochraceum DSM 14365]